MWHRMFIPFLWLGAAAKLPAPWIRFNATRALTIAWEAPPTATASEYHYQLELAVTPRDHPAFHITRHAAAGAHSLYWPNLPERADLCFRVASIAGAYEPALDESIPGSSVGSSVSENAPAPVYSDPTCYSSCTCVGADAGSGGGGEPQPGCAGGGSSFSSAIGGALVGALLTLGCLVVCSRRGYLTLLDACPKEISTKLGGSSYSHLTTAEPGLELNPPPPCQPYHSASACSAAGAALSLGGTAAAGASLNAVALEPPPDISGADFELRWSSCATRSHALKGRLPPLPPGAVDEIEAALVAKGFFCVAAGAVGDVHKLYLAGQLGGSRDWLMLELVLSWQAGSVQATFRCDAHSKLIPLSDEFAAVLSAVMRTKLAPSYD